MVAAVLGTGGCSTRLARENVFANTESAFGLTVAENPQTQMYELKLGYARHELFYVPSSKLVFYEKGAGKGREVAPTSITNYNDPSSTPEVLAEIQIGGSGQSRGGSFTLRQRLAIGKNAVGAPAAVGLMAGDSQAAMEVVRVANDPTIAEQRARLDALLKKDLKPDALCGTRKRSEFNTNQEFADCLAKQIAPDSTLAQIRFYGGPNLDKLIQSLQAALKP
jgi:hypothetical protein